MRPSVPPQPTSLVVQAGAAVLASGQAATGNGGRSPGLILLVAGLALVLISLQSLSEVSDLLLQHVDDALLEDGTLFAAIDLSRLDWHSVNDYDEETVHERKDIALGAKSKQQSSTNTTRPRIKEEAMLTAATRDDDGPIVLNIGFRTFNDKMKLINSKFDKAELDEIVEYVFGVWRAANIVLNFTREDDVDVDDAKGDAYKWLVLGNKDQKKATKFWSDVSLFLRKGPGKVSPKQTSEIISKYFQYSGYPLMDWIMDSDVEEAGKSSYTDFDVAVVSHWPWNNGGNLGHRLVVRSASCNATLAPSFAKSLRTKKTDLILCNGWKKDTRDLDVITPIEAARVVSHLIGRRLGLRQLPREMCQEAGVKRLMCRASGSSASPDAKWSQAVRLDADEIRRARVNARLLISRRP